MDEVARRFHDDPAIRERLAHTLAAGSVNPDDYAGIFFVGATAPCGTSPTGEALQRLTARIYESGGAVGAVCHGPSALVNVRLSDGRYLVADRDVAGFTTEEEQAVRLDAVVPFLLDERLQERGGRHTRSSEPFVAHVVRDGRLITGQNPPSSADAARALVAAIRQAESG
ncbi:MAG: type 1 glutamine amidotransferase domain-containing protein [Arhodomonas sp.]|nr:type 1 glutamine amidotransferase domain-containing protein [Arhodomonas sp.]